MDVGTPALLFPAISLLLLAFTNRFLAIASLIRNLTKEYRNNHDDKVKIQISLLRRRLFMIRNMQIMGVLSLFLCVLAMFLIFAEWILVAKYAFGVSLCCMLGSLTWSLAELLVSIQALNIELSDIEKSKKASR
ncbi:MAG: DUF2721 domain-containing protein [Bacteroidetes bacterium]|nr:MAG: DUF2721 domain-containing protein [Bacteroidota bacterium]